jgi:hypothetical protein
MEPQLSPPCSPDLTNFKHSSPCHTEQQRSWPSERTTNNRSTKMLTAVVVDSQMANCNRFGYQQAIPHSPFIASTSGVLVLQARKRKRSFQWPGLTIPSQYKSVKTDTSMAWIKKNQSSLHKRHTGQGTVPCGQPFRDYSNMKVQTFSSVLPSIW